MDVSPFDQRPFDCRCDWGPMGFDALSPADVVIVVDVLSFSTCVDIAVSRGVSILPYPWKDASASAFASARDAVLAGHRCQGGEGGFSLSPESFLQAPRGLRCVLPSPNGATVAVRASEAGAVVLAGCLRNASAIATAAAALGSTFNVCPAGERWPDGSLRFAVEDWLAAGAIARLLPGSKSPEALAATAAFENNRSAMLEALNASSSGRELISRGFPRDVEIAADVDVSTCVPRLEQGAFVAYRS